MGAKDSSGGQAKVRDTTDIHPGCVVLASSTLPDPQKPGPQPYVVLFRKQKYVISLPFTSPALCGMFGGGRRPYEREPDTYYPIAPNENGGIYDPVKMVLGSFSGYIDLLCPTTLGKHAIEWGGDMGMISSEDLTKVVDAHKRLVWGLEGVPQKPATAPPLADMSSGTPPPPQSELGSTQDLKSDCRSPYNRRRVSTKVRPHNRHGLDGGSSREGRRGNEDSRGITVRGGREASPRNGSRKHKRKRQNSGQSSLKRTRHVSPDPRDAVQGIESRAGRGALDCYKKLAEGDRDGLEVLEDVSPPSPASAKSWIWLGTSNELEETSEATGEGEIGQEDIAIPNMTPSSGPPPRALPSNGRASPHHGNRLTRCLPSPTPSTADATSAGARNLLPKSNGDEHYEFPHHYSARPHCRS